MAVATGTAILGAAGITAATGVASAAMSSDPKDTSRFAFATPEQEIEALGAMRQDQQRIEGEFQRASEARDAFAEKVRLLDETPDSLELQQKLGEQSLRIANAIGQSAEELVSNGFLSGSDAELLAGGKGGDPRIERQIDDERARLEQDLARAGVSPAGRAQAMSQFEAQAKEQRFSGNIGLGQIRQQNLQSGLQGLGGVQSEMQRRIGNRANILQANLAVGQAAGQVGQSNLQRQQFAGKLNLSGTARDALRGGLVGPGTVREQTGVSAREVGKFANIVSDVERDKDRGTLDQIKKTQSRIDFRDRYNRPDDSSDISDRESALEQFKRRLKTRI